MGKMVSRLIAVAIGGGIICSLTGCGQSSGLFSQDGEQDGEELSRQGQGADNEHCGSWRNVESCTCQMGPPCGTSGTWKQRKKDCKQKCGTVPNPFPASVTDCECK